jgi:predicted nucleic acid-binding protein
MQSSRNVKRVLSSPCYLDASALAKLYIPEPASEELESLLVGRSDLLISSLAVTELTSALARRVREGAYRAIDARRVYRGIVRDGEEGRFRIVDGGIEAWRAAERILLTVGIRFPLRTGDALHLATASLAGARSFATYDRRLRTAAEELGTFETL